VTIQKENEAPLSPKARGEEWGGSISSSSNSEVWESVLSFASGLCGRAPAENVFYSNLA